MGADSEPIGAAVRSGTDYLEWMVGTWSRQAKKLAGQLDRDDLTTDQVARNLADVSRLFLTSGAMSVVTATSVADTLAQTISGPRQESEDFEIPLILQGKSPTFAMKGDLLDDLGYENVPAAQVTFRVVTKSTFRLVVPTSGRPAGGYSGVVVVRAEGWADRDVDVWIVL